MERSVAVATGESVAFSYELAGLGSRFFAVVIDIAIQLAVVLALLLLLALVVNALPARAHVDVPSKLGRAVLEGLGIVAAFLLFFGYFILFEWLWHGRTPGKRIVGIRVVRDGGFPLDFGSAVVRNVIRILEFGLGLYAISAVSTLLSPRNRRLGDMAAGTLVVRDSPFERAPDLPSYARNDDPLVRDLGFAERELIQRYAARRASLSHAARAKIAGEIAVVVRPQLAAPFDHLDDDALLMHLASTSLAAPETTGGV